jgi:hypothetical protein
VTPGINYPKFEYSLVGGRAAAAVKQILDHGPRGSAGHRHSVAQRTRGRPWPGYATRGAATGCESPARIRPRGSLSRSPVAARRVVEGHTGTRYSLSRFYEVSGVFRLAVICQQIYHRRTTNEAFRLHFIVVNLLE